MGNLEGLLNESSETTKDNFQPLPMGDYVFYVADAEMIETKKSVTMADGKPSHLAIKLTFEVVEGKYTKRKIFMHLNIKNPSIKAQDIAIKEINKIAKACKILNIKDSCELIGQKLVCSLVVEKDDYKGDGFFKNEIKGYKEYKADEVKSNEPDLAF